jgi:hypothetical protein
MTVLRPTYQGKLRICSEHLQKKKYRRNHGGGVAMDRINSKNEKMLIEGLARMHADSIERRRKDELARWATEIQVPFSLGNMLSIFTKSALDNMRQCIGARGLSSLNKQKLASALEETVVCNAARLFSLLDTSQYNLLKRVVDSGGMTDTFVIDDDQVEYFRDRGILFPGRCKGKKVLAASAEIMTEFRKADDQEIRNSAQRNTEWVRLAHGLLYYYGTIPVSRLIDKIKSLTKVQTANPVRIVEIIVENALPYYQRIQIGPKGISNIEVSDPETIVREHAARPDLDYYPFKYDEIWRAGDEGFVDKSIAFKRCSRFITDNYEITVQEADELVEECVWIIQDPEKPDHQISEIFELLQSRLEFDSQETAEQFAKHFVELHNSTRQWTLKGWSPSELAQAKRRHLHPLPSNPHSLSGLMDGKVASRNAPCPCGSGKKYKKCCGREE